MAAPEVVPISLLEEQVVRLGVCPKCHTKTLDSVHSADQFNSYQCTTCKDVWMLGTDHERKS
jgi:Zn-finger nucleic acid-binding protein